MSGQVLTSKDIFCWQRGVTPLHLACRHGHTQVVRLLVDHGGDVNLPSRGGVCSLHLAARCGHSHVVELLLDKGDFHMHLSSFGVPKEMSKAMVAILVWEISWFYQIWLLAYILESQIWHNSTDSTWPWHYSIHYIHRSGNAQDAVVLQLCYWGRPPKTK